MSAKLVTLPGGGGDVIEPDWATRFVNDDGKTDPGELAFARETWRQTVTEMRNAGTLAPANGEQIARYVAACVLYHRAEIEVFKRGPVINRSGRQLPAWNLWFSAMKDSAGLASDLEAELGLSPRRRASATAAKKRATKTTAADSYLGAASKG